MRESGHLGCTPNCSEVPDPPSPLALPLGTPPPPGNPPPLPDPQKFFNTVTGRPPWCHPKGGAPDVAQLFGKI